MNSYLCSHYRNAQILQTPDQCENIIQEQIVINNSLQLGFRNVYIENIDNIKLSFVCQCFFRGCGDSNKLFAFVLVMLLSDISFCLSNRHDEND